MIFVLQEAEASVLLLVIGLVVQDDVTEALWKTPQKKTRVNARGTTAGRNVNAWTGSFLPVTLANSSTICSFVLLLGMEPTNSRLLATEIQTPICLPGRISWLLHWKTNQKTCRLSPWTWTLVVDYEGGDASPAKLT